MQLFPGVRLVIFGVCPCLIPRALVAVQRVCSVMVADAVKNTGIVAKWMVADECEGVLDGAAQFEPNGRFESDAAPAYVRAQRRVLPGYLVHFQDTHGDPNRMPRLSSSVGCG